MNSGDAVMVCDSSSDSSDGSDLDESDIDGMYIAYYVFLPLPYRRILLLGTCAYRQEIGTY